MRRALLLAALALLCAPSSACTPPASREGSSCLFSDECPAGLLCVAERCRVACRTQRDCAPGTQCRQTESPGLTACLPDSVPPLCAYPSDCGAGRWCSARGRCVAECAGDDDCAAWHPALRCQRAAGATEGTCVWPTEASAADAGGG